MPIPVLAAAGAVQGLFNMAGSMVGGRARRREQAQAQQQLKQRMGEYENMQFTNPYAGLENTMEDLTVNQQQAQFLAQQQQQGLANTMGAMQGAAGGSGIAALAQAMANQQSQNLQQASASIGQQEARNQVLAAQGANQVQQLQAQGDAMVQGREQARTETLLGMAQTRLGAANQARQNATDQLMGGIGDLAGGALAMAGGESGTIF
jgi:hypothetical protein